MRRRIRCIFHKEATPSLVQRKDGWYCYGACHKLYTNKEVQERTGEAYEYEEEDTEKEDIGDSIKRLESLPFRDLRGLRFRSDASGFYVLWPSKKYYKYRRFNAGDLPKYIGPRGYAPPLFWARQEDRPILGIVEGEINSLSIAEVVDWDVCSPGSASCFNSDNLARYLSDFKRYSSIIVILDKDSAGSKALIEAKSYLLYKVPFLTFFQIAPDANEILVTHGKEALKRTIDSYMQTQMQGGRSG